MNNQRLNIGEVLAAGILNRSVPKTEIPKDREMMRIDVDEMPSNEVLISAVDAGKLLECCEYYGIPSAWKAHGVYRGTLLQYRAITENPTFTTAEDLIQWFRAISYSVCG